MTCILPEMDRTIVLETRTLVKTSKPAQQSSEALQLVEVGMVFAKMISFGHMDSTKRVNSY